MLNKETNEKLINTLDKAIENLEKLKGLVDTVKLLTGAKK